MGSRLIKITLPLLLLMTLIPMKKVRASGNVNARYVNGTVPEMYYCTSVKTDNKDPYDILSDATLDKLGKGYRVLEGGGTDGQYAYFCIWNKSKNQCKVVKVSLEPGKAPRCLAVSDVLLIDHGNDIAYDSKNDRLVVVHCLYSNGYGNKEISFLDRETLQIINKTDDVLLPDDVQIDIRQNMNKNNPSLYSGMTQKEIPIGFDGIAYNENKDQYALLLKDTSYFVIIDSDFHFVKLIKTDVREDYINQGIDSANNYLVISQSRKNTDNGNVLSIYNWDDGSYVRTVKLLGMYDNYEIENIFHIGNVMYASCYYNSKQTSQSQYQYGYLYTFGYDPIVYDISLSKSSFKIHPYQKVSLKNYVSIDAGNGADQSLAFSSSNSAVAKVSSEGIVTAVKAGTAVITIRPNNGNGAAKCTITVWKDTPKTPSGLKLKKNNKKRKLKVSWKKVGNPTGYRVWISLDKKFRKAKKYKTKVYMIKNSKTLSLTLKKLKKNKKYYVKVQSYIKYGNDVYYSKCSKIKKVYMK